MAIRILIADDQELERQGLRSLLESHEGWEVCGEAEDGDEAVAKAAALSPDAIILDLAMPRMDGLEAARHIHKAAPHRAHNPPHDVRLARSRACCATHGHPQGNLQEQLPGPVAELERLFRDRASLLTEPLGTPRVNQLDESKKKASASDTCSTDVGELDAAPGLGFWAKGKL